MELYIGGTAQGKKAYVTQVRGIDETRIWDNFEVWFREKLQENCVESVNEQMSQKHSETVDMQPTQNHPEPLSPEEECLAYLKAHPDTVLICDEVGNGIVPLDPFEREYRERLGRLLCEIAADAERVERIVCGIGQRIK